MPRWRSCRPGAASSSDAIFRGADADYAQVSEATGMPVGSIGPTRGRALVELRGQMKRGGYGPEDLVA